MHKIVNCCLLMAFLMPIWISGQDHVSEEELNYYVKLVEEGQAAALKYKLPVDASQYKGNYNSTNDDVEVTGLFDYIIIGSGSGGSVMANRLSELSSSKTLLLEAGSFENNFTDIPGMGFYAQGTKYNWAYTTVPQVHACLGMVNKQCVYPRGKGFGGTTIINGLVYSRGNRADYDKWEAEGNKGWSYKDVLPYFLKSENASFPGWNDGYHSNKGLLHVEMSPYESVHLNAYLEANRQVGHPVLDYNGANELGASKAQLNTLHGRRFTAADAFLRPSVIKRQNLKLSSNSFVIKILINPKTKVAYGVLYMRDGKKHVATATKEVILSAGTIGSPQILMLSGVGRKNHLKEKNIPVIADLAVGDNFQDHSCFFGLNIESNSSIAIKSLRGYLDEYLHDEGVLTLPGNNAGVGFYRVDNSTNGPPDYELMLIPPNRTDSYTQRGFGYSDETYKAFLANVHTASTFTIYIDVLHPHSVGTLRLKSNNPFTYPVIDPQFLSDKGDHDINVLYAGVQMVMRLLKTDAFKSINATLGKVILPKCANLEYLSKSFWFCTIRHLTDNLYHPTGSCKMGPNPKNGAVVNSKLQVHGIRNLRVVDASIMPHPISGHTNAPTTMIAEKAADFIKAVRSEQIR